MKNNQASHKLLRFIGSMSDQDQENLIKAIQQTETEIEELHIVHLAMQLERIGEWKLAQEQWESIGRSQDAEICKSINKTIQERINK